MLTKKENELLEDIRKKLGLIEDDVLSIYRGLSSFIISHQEDNIKIQRLSEVINQFKEVVKDI